MRKTWWRHEELWVPWLVKDDPDASFTYKGYEVPDELIKRFEAAKAEMEAVWDELYKLMRDDY